MSDWTTNYRKLQKLAQSLHGDHVDVPTGLYRDVLDSMTQELKHETRRRTRVSTLEQEAADLILDWYKTGDEYMVTPFDAGFIGSHYRACTWAVFLRKQHINEAHT